MYLMLEHLHVQWCQVLLQHSWTRMSFLSESWFASRSDNCFYMYTNVCVHYSNLLITAILKFSLAVSLRSMAICTQNKRVKQISLDDIILRMLSLSAAGFSPEYGVHYLMAKCYHHCKTRPKMSMWESVQVPRLHLCNMRVLKYYVKNKALLRRYTE